MATTTPRNPASAADVRAWARQKGMIVGQRGHLPTAVIKAFNRSHRRFYTDRNPFNQQQEQAVTA